MCLDKTYLDPAKPCNRPLNPAPSNVTSRISNFSHMMPVAGAASVVIMRGVLIGALGPRDGDLLSSPSCYASIASSQVCCAPDCRHLIGLFFAQQDSGSYLLLTKYFDRRPFVFITAWFLWTSISAPIKAHLRLKVGMRLNRDLRRYLKENDRTTATWRDTSTEINVHGRKYRFRARRERERMGERESWRPKKIHTPVNVFPIS